MSGLDPLAAALAAQAAANAQAAMDEAILNLGADIAAIQSQVSVGDVIAATVLPPQGGSDLLSFLGQTYPAQLPSGVNPGESLLLEVTSFTNNAVIVRNLGTADPQNPVPTVNVELPPPTATAVSQLTTPQPPPAQTLSSNVAPPRAVFIAAAVRAAPPPALPPDAVERANAAVAQSVPVSNDVETRIAIMRAGSAPVQPAQTSQAQQQQQLPQPTLTAARLPVAPPIVLAASPRTSVTQVQPDTPEAALLSRLRVPITPATVAAARLVDRATASLTSAYEKLDSALGRLGASAQIPAALRSTLSFVARMDLRNAATLPEQIAAFVSDVVDGAEAKVAQTVQAWLAIEPQSAEEGASQLPATQQPTPAAVTSATAQASERTIALAYDPKAAIMTVLANASSGVSPSIVGALRDALTATTAVQLNALSAQENDPSAITLALPAYFYEGGAPAQLRITRDAPNSKNKMDADNFHIAFILDTQSLGTVAIDVQTAGRAVSVDVKTQASLAADRFRTSFGDLRGRLERLRYRIANINAGVAGPASAAAPKAQAEAPPASRSLWDMRA